MAALGSGRCLAGSQAFTGVRPRQVSLLSNGSKYFMKRKDSYMVEVQVGEEEAEDIAVRKFMRKVMDSHIIDQLRSRRHHETPFEKFKRRTRERIQKIKNGYLEPTWEEENPQEIEVKPFSEFFPTDQLSSDFLNGPFSSVSNDDYFANGGYMDAGAGGGWGSYNMGGSKFGGGYVNQPGYNFSDSGLYQQSYQSGYMDQGGYMAQPSGGYTGQQGGYMGQQGGYMGQGYTEQWTADSVPAGSYEQGSAVGNDPAYTSPAQ